MHFNRSQDLIVTSPHSRSYITLSAITLLYAMSAYGTFGYSVSHLGAVIYNLEASMSVVAGDGVTSTSTEELSAPDTLNGGAFSPSIEQVLSIIISDGLLVSLHCILSIFSFHLS